MQHLHQQYLIQENDGYYAFNKEIRSSVIDYLVNISDEYAFKHSTIHLGINLFDRYLLTNSINDDQMKIIGTICLFIAVKIEEIKNPTIINLEEWISEKNTDDVDNSPKTNYSRQDLIKLEQEILEKLQYNVYCNTIVHYLNLFNQTAKLSKKNYIFSLYLAIILLTTIDYIFVEPYFLAQKIAEFVLAFDNDDIIWQIQNNIMYEYIYLTWKNMESSKLASIRKMFGEEKYMFTAAYKSTMHVSYESNTKTISMPRNFIKTSIKSLISTNFYTEESIDDSIIVNELGRGTFGVVCRTFITCDKDKCSKEIALKKILSRDTDFDGINGDILRELNALYILDHPNIIKLHGFYYNSSTRISYIGMEYMHGCLHSQIKNGVLTKQTKERYILQLLRGLKYMHSRNIMHRDLSTANVLISNDGQLKIGDFGSSRYFYHSNRVSSYSSYICSLQFRSIELLLGQNLYTELIDVWSCGFIIGYILNNTYLLSSDNEIDMISQIFRVLGTPCDTYNPQLCTWPNFNREKWKQTPKKGFTHLEIKYPIFTPILYQMLEYNPANRISADNALTQFTAAIANNSDEYEIKN